MIVRYGIDMWGVAVYFPKVNKLFNKFFKIICLKKKWKVRYLRKILNKGGYRKFYYSRRMPRWKRRRIFNKNNLLYLRTGEVWRTYYGDYSTKKFKYFIQRLKRRKKDFISKSLTLFESRLDMLLYRLNYFKSPRESRNFARNKNVMINDKIKKNLNIQLYINDIIQVKQKWWNVFHQKILENLKEKILIYTNPKYLETSYTLLKSIFILYPKKNEIPFIIKLDWHFIRYLLLF